MKSKYYSNPPIDVIPHRNGLLELWHQRREVWWGRSEREKLLETSEINFQTDTPSHRGKGKYRDMIYIQTSGHDFLLFWNQMRRNQSGSVGQKMYWQVLSPTCLSVFDWAARRYLKCLGLWKYTCILTRTIWLVSQLELCCVYSIKKETLVQSSLQNKPVYLTSWRKMVPTKYCSGYIK